jgi:hypothetical protein
LSGINSVTAVGLQTYIKQTTISALNCGISLICGIITSIELFLNLQKKMEMEMSSSRDYHKIAIEIYKVLSLERENRMIDGKSFLDEKFADYLKLSQTSNIIDEKYSVYDEMAPNISFQEALVRFEKRAEKAALDYSPRARPSSLLVSYIPSVFSVKKNNNDSVSSISSAVLGVVNSFTPKKRAATTTATAPPTKRAISQDDYEIRPQNSTNSSEEKTDNLRGVASRDLFIEFNDDELSTAAAPPSPKV